MNLNTIQHPQNSWESRHPLELLEGLLSAGGISVWENIISVIVIFLPCLTVLNTLLQEVTPVISISSMVLYLLNVMNWGAFSTRARVTLDTHLDIDAWLIPMVSPIDV